MSFKIKILPSGHEFTAENNESILDAALRQGFAFRYGCRGGACGSCKGKVVSGSVRYEVEPISLSEADKLTGTEVFCKALPTSDMEIEVKEIGAAKDIVVKTLPARVAKMERLADEVIRIYLKLPMTERLQFLAGQYIDFLLRDGRRRSFSLANPPHDDELLELHVRKVENGFYTTHIFEEMQEKALVRIEGPLGTFTFDEESKRPAIFIAGGTGFAPIKAILEHLFSENIHNPIYFYWGGRNLELLYLHDLPEQWQQQHANFKYIPVLSEPRSEDNWSGRTGLVHEAVLNDFDNLSEFDIYACGPPAMIDAARKDFLAKGMVEDQFFTDAFTFAGD